MPNLRKTHTHTNCAVVHRHMFQCLVFLVHTTGKFAQARSLVHDFSRLLLFFPGTITKTTSKDAAPSRSRWHSGAITYYGEEDTYKKVSDRDWRNDIQRCLDLRCSQIYIAISSVHDPLGCWEHLLQFYAHSLHTFLWLILHDLYLVHMFASWAVKLLQDKRIWWPWESGHSAPAFHCWPLRATYRCHIRWVLISFEVETRISTKRSHSSSPSLPLQTWINFETGKRL